MKRGTVDKMKKKKRVKWYFYFFLWRCRKNLSRKVSEKIGLRSLMGSCTILGPKLKKMLKFI